MLARTNRDGFRRKGPVRSMREECPHAPFSVAMSIAQDWKYVESHAAEWEAKYRKDPTVLFHLGKKYVALGRFDDAIRCLKLSIEAAPLIVSYRCLADAYYGKEDYALWRESLDQALGLIAYESAHAEIKNTIAQHYIKLRDWQTALPFAEAAAESDKIWGLLTAARCHEGLGNWARAEEFVERASQQRESSGVEWFLWCRRTGLGNVQAAQLHAQQQLNRLGPELPAEKLEEAGTFYLLIGRVPSAFAAFTNLHQQQKSRVSAALHAALLAGQLSKSSERDSLLAEMILAKDSLKGNKRALVYVGLAALFQRALADETGGGVDPQAVDKLLESAEPDVQTDVNYFVGTFLRLHGSEARGVAFLKRCAESSQKDRLTCTLAADYLRRNPPAGNGP
jgi:tetratricopeptide (TPR) repeat protein